MTAVTVAGRAVVTGLFCVLLGACGTTVAGRTAAPPSGVPASPTCTPNLPTEEDTGTPNLPTEEDTGTPDIPTEEDTGTPDIPTEEDTGAPVIPTEEDTGAPEPPTDGGLTGSAAPCAVVAGWYDMTRDFNDYYAGHRTEADHFMPQGSVKEVRIRKTAKTGEAWVTFSTDSVGKGLGEDARRVAEVFGAWRHEVYGDKGTVGVQTEEGAEIVTTAW